MARRTVSITTITPTAYADTTNLTNATYPFMLQGGSATQLNKIWEISLSGQAGSSAPSIMLLSRDSTIGLSSNTNGTGQTDAANDPATAALAAPVLTGNTWNTLPQRSSTLHLANLSFNAFGSNYFWRANRLEECYSVLGNTASLGEASVTCFTGGTPGLMGGHMIYETV